MLYPGTCRCQLEWPLGAWAIGDTGALARRSIVTVPPAFEPLTLDEVKLDRRVDNSLDDTLLTALIQASREYCEGWTGSSFVTQTRQVTVPKYVDGMALPYGPVQSVESVEDGANGGSVVTYVAGFPSLDPPIDEDGQATFTANVPASIKVAMKLLIGDWYEHREQTLQTISSTLDVAVHSLLGQWRLRLGIA